MSVLDKVLQGHTPETHEVTLREAAATVLAAAVVVDGALAPEEVLRLRSQLSSMRLYSGVEPEHVQHLLDAAFASVERQGVEALLPSCAAVVPDDLRAPLFALAVELVFADGRIAEREKRFVDALQAALDIADDTATKIVEVLLLKGRI